MAKTCLENEHTWVLRFDHEVYICLACNESRSTKEWERCSKCHKLTKKTDMLPLPEQNMDNICFSCHREPNLLGAEQ